MSNKEKRSLDDLANGEQSETKLVHSSTATSIKGAKMANNKRGSLDDLANGEKSETKLVRYCI